MGTNVRRGGIIGVAENLLQQLGGKPFFDGAGRIGVARGVRRLFGYAETVKQRVKIALAEILNDLLAAVSSPDTGRCT